MGEASAGAIGTCSEPGCTAPAESICHACGEPYCHRHLKRGTWYDGEVYDRCVDCSEPSDQGEVT